MAIPLVCNSTVFSAVSVDTTTTLKSLNPELQKAVSVILEMEPTAFSGTLDIQGRADPNSTYANIMYVDIASPSFPLSIAQLSYTTSSTKKLYLIPATLPDIQVVMTRSAGSITARVSGYGVAFPIPAGADASRAIIANDPSPALTVIQHGTGDIQEWQDGGTMVWQMVDGGLLQAADDEDLGFGSASGADVLIRWSTGDASNHAFVLALDDTAQQMHITDKGAVATDWARNAGTHPELAIHSNTTPATDYLAIGNHDGTTAYIDVVGGTTLSLKIAGTEAASLTAAGLFLGSADKIDFNAANMTITHAAGKLTVAGGTLNLAGNLVLDSALDIVIVATTTAALEISDGTTKFLAIDTRTAAVVADAVKVTVPIADQDGNESAFSVAATLNKTTAAETGTIYAASFGIAAGATNTQNWTQSPGMVAVDGHPQTITGMTGTITLAAGFRSRATIAAGTVTLIDHFRASDATGAGTVTEQAGFHVKALTKGATGNYQVLLDNGGTEPTAAKADTIAFYSVDVAANTVPGLVAETAAAVSAGTASTHKIAFRYNNATYYWLVTNV